jgi:hypothetical protein
LAAFSCENARLNDAGAVAQGWFFRFFVPSRFEQAYYVE